jgi:UDP-N-acetylglucosamine 2-epimerase (non-hydrolysing)
LKIITILGTRPEIIRLSRVIEKLDGSCDHILVHTGQNFDPALSDIFFHELGIRRPDYYLGVQAASFGEQIGQILAKSEEIFRDEKPDRLLILGDTNSGISAIIAKRLGISVYHMEAGNRCYDDRVPEETNRRIIDHSSDFLLPYTERSRANLIREGIPGERIYVTGNPILEVMQHNSSRIESSKIFEVLEIERGQYFLVTMHRAENVDDPDRLRSITESLQSISIEYGKRIICSTHPRTRDRMQSHGVSVDDEKVKFLPPFGFFDFIALEKNAYCVLSDSGTVQEECCILKIPNVTIRDVTERPETIECGSNILSGVEPKVVLRAVRCVIEEQVNWTIPPEYENEHVSTTVLKILTGYHHK